MQTARSKAEVFTKGSKLFVICGIVLECYSLKSCEVYDLISQKFTFIKINSQNLWAGNLFCTHYNDSKIILVHGNFYCFYNITTNTWSDKYILKFEKRIYSYSCVDLNKLNK